VFPEDHIGFSKGALLNCLQQKEDTVEKMSLIMVQGLANYNKVPGRTENQKV
jgi:hypothetical protein